jgi:predicted nucleic acid-binding protein
VNRFAVDTGPLVALLDARDAHHEWARTLFGELAPPLVTCEPVVAEACHLVRKLRGGGALRVLDLVDRGVIDPRFRLADEQRRVGELVERYASVPMSLADACLVRMTELEPELTVITLDDDFRVYRRNARQVVPVIMPNR